ncbi:MOSC domain-containing protein [uncultured Corynebacterium sp.]|uniref:MOSC domain-containing protein n=1 Tax=uncultured Corynebacterium sp. TaxID=159447 RepID=UPI0025D3CB55|nr:MOSC domain-containing protein [uncultured Corynebacterium sp.]
MRVISTNVAVRRPDPSGRHEFSGIDKKPQDFIDVAAPGPHYGDGSGVRGDIIGATQHHGGNDKAVYAYSREELDYWQSELSRPLASGGFGENLTTQGVDLSALLINQRVCIGTAVLEVSVPRQPCATFACWLGERGWLKRWTARGDCGTYLRIISPGRIRPGDTIELDATPSHDITMRMAFAAKMGDRALAQRVIDARCLPAHQQNSLRT